MTTISDIRKGETVVLSPDRAAFEGRAVARVESLVVFVDGAVPGDTVRAFVYRKKQQYAEARAVELLAPSPDRAEAPCAHFGVCGGCSWQHMVYRRQCDWKREHVVDAFARIGGFEDVPVRETLPCTETFYYRNKMEYTFGETRWLLPDELGVADRAAETFALGLHVPGRYDRILHIDACHLQSPASNAVLAATRSYFLARGAAAFTTRTNMGILRHLVIREGKKTGDRMVFLVTSPVVEEIIDGYAERLRDPALGVTTFVHGVTERPSSVAQAQRQTVRFGTGTITDEIGGITYAISPSSFFQTNTAQAERLYALAGECAGIGPEDTVWDLYCGAGTIALYVAKHAARVLGVEVHAPAVEDAIANAARNGVGNVEFLCSDMTAFLKGAAGRSDARPDVILLDPPRSGLHPEVARTLGDSSCERIVYVSCNPTTSARDCRMLADKGWRITEIAPVDMFPHTYHVECVIALTRA